MLPGYRNIIKLANLNWFHYFCPRSILYLFLIFLMFNITQNKILEKEFKQTCISKNNNGSCGDTVVGLAEVQIGSP